MVAFFDDVRMGSSHGMCQNQWVDIFAAYSPQTRCATDLYPTTEDSSVSTDIRLNLTTIEPDTNIQPCEYCLGRQRLVYTPELYFISPGTLPS